MSIRERGCTVTMQEDTTLVRLDFGEHGYVDVPPECAQTFISSEELREQIRRECRRAHQARQRIARENNGKPSQA